MPDDEQKLNETLLIRAEAIEIGTRLNQLREREAWLKVELRFTRAGIRGLETRKEELRAAAALPEGESCDLPRTN